MISIARSRSYIARTAGSVGLLVLPHLAWAQEAQSPFLTGANALQTNILAWMTPIAIILVICLYCQTGFIDGEATMDFSVSNVTRIDEALRLQLTSWPRYHPVRHRGIRGCFANHCARCERPQVDFYLHCQPGGPFFSFQDPVARHLKIHALLGQVRLSGDEGFEP